MWTIIVNCTDSSEMETVFSIHCDQLDTGVCKISAPGKYLEISRFAVYLIMMSEFFAPFILPWF